MPTRTQLIVATPRCPGYKPMYAVFQECGRLLVWKHDHGVWACPKHGLVTIEPHELEAAA